MAGPYTNPIGPGLLQGRVDEGVDFSGAGPLYALGDGVITNVYQGGWPGGVYILLHLTGPGPAQGRYVYYAENIAPSVQLGQQVRAGDIIGWARGVYPFIEIGWGTSLPGVTAAASHYTEGVPTSEGQSFLGLLTALRTGNEISTGQGGPGAVAGPEPLISAQLGQAAAAMGTLTHRGMPAYGRTVRNVITAASRLYIG